MTAINKSSILFKFDLRRGRVYVISKASLKPHFIFNILFQRRRSGSIPIPLFLTA